MEQIIDIAYANLLSPMILFFILGIIAVLVNSDLQVPSAFYTGYTMIILFTIGIKGGVELSHVPFLSMLPAVLAALILSFFMLGITFLLLRYVYRFSLDDSTAIAAHYGSVSAVTFVAALSFLDKINMPYESYIAAILVIMEGPAIVTAIVINRMLSKNKQRNEGLSHVFKEAFFGKSIFLLLGGMVIGLIAHEDGIAKIKPLFGDLFYGVLCIFLLHMGMIATQKIRELKNINLVSFSFAFILPLIGGVLGVMLGTFIGMSIGGVTMLATLAASASYIAAPAAVEQAIPHANSGLYIGSALGLTLPFNLIVGIPLYFWLANTIAS
ncbi:sodium-dependent bicarbonate transport family permease [Ammoniphilus sp. CFH 90114]|uniref:sodium-dependent bicarbonate transport family permease n=1 Tax=Ammoniphilus sp. CFH 90114 TaxID=2493665 RepID=UPI00100E197B|nr:sodium-dependent bicarbonate transport family permease [Ammoniphilus sp. CFH 90114]RXT05812.1 sodium-dependent bicarbonate transport family permease [Ammoniphilus sp. CFH 90114]